MPPTLTDRELGRALLARQLLLERNTTMTAADTVEHLLGLQAQATMPPYIGLFSRLEQFDPHELGRLLSDRTAVRLTLMRATVHLVTADDALRLRPLLQEMIERRFSGEFRRRMAGTDLAELGRVTRELLDAASADPEAAAPTARDLGRALIERGIGSDLEAVATVVRVCAPIVQVPPRGVWGAGGQARYATLETWTGRPLERAPSIDELVVRYLGAFGPASVMDAQNWSGLTKLRDVLERLRPRLITFRDERGVELFDLPDAPRPAADVPAPPRFLGEFDNVLLGHADRSRIVPAGIAPWMEPIMATRHVNNLLVDGVLRAVWWVERDGKRAATLTIRPHDKLTAAERRDVVAEARRVLAFAAADAAAHEVRFEAAS